MIATESLTTVDKRDVTMMVLTTELRKVERERDYYRDRAERNVSIADDLARACQTQREYVAGRLDLDRLIGQLAAWLRREAEAVPTANSVVSAFYRRGLVDGMHKAAAAIDEVRVGCKPWEES